VLGNGGLAPGGLNFDAKVRRESTDLEDLFIGYIGGIDAFARGLLIADRVLADPRYKRLRQSRYASFAAADGQRFEAGELTLPQLSDIALAGAEPHLQSGKQELVENLINDHMFRDA